MEQDAAVESYSKALGHAVDQGNVKLAEELLKAGADVNHEIKLRDPEYEEGSEYVYFTPIIIANRNNHLEMVKLLLEYNPNVNDRRDLPLVRAAEYGNLEIVETLLDHPGIVVSATDLDGSSALKAASEKGAYEIAKLLVDHGGHTNKEYSEALATAAGLINCFAARRTDVIRLLLEHGADPNHSSRVYGPPLRSLLSSWGRHLDAVRLLVRGGATLERSFRLLIRSSGGFYEDALEWLSENTTTQTILSFKGLQQRTQDHAVYRFTVLSNWDKIVIVLWFHYFGPNREGDPPCIADTARLSDEAFKMAYKWMIHAVSSLLFLEEGNILLPHLCRIFHTDVALEACELTAKTPLLLALEMFPQRDDRAKQQYAASGIDLLIEWNPDALKVLHPKTCRTPMTCAIVNQVPLPTLQRMITCKDEKWFTMSPLQQDPVTSLPNFLLVAAGKDCYSVANIYLFSRNYLPDIISSFKSPTGVSRRGIKRSLEQI